MSWKDWLILTGIKDMRLLVLDFDHGCTFVQIKRRCDDMGLGIAYAYHTLSSSVSEERFRVVFVCEEVIKDLFIIKAVRIRTGCFSVERN